LGLRLARILRVASGGLSFFLENCRRERAGGRGGGGEKWGSRPNCRDVVGGRREILKLFL
jgi:hypothetical protein